MGSYVAPQYWRPEDFDRTIVQLRKLREEAGLTQWQLSQLLGYLGHNAVAEFESGRRVPPTRIFWEWPRQCGKTWILAQLDADSSGPVDDRRGPDHVESGRLNFPMDTPEVME